MGDIRPASVNHEIGDSPDFGGPPKKEQKLVIPTEIDAPLTC